MSHFPPNYKELTYVEPYCNHKGVINFKQPSKEEVINNPDKELSSILRVIRDQYDQFLKALEKDKTGTDELSKAATAFLERKINPNNIESISERLKDVFILSESPIKVIKIFNDENTVLYCNPPRLPEVSKNAENYEGILDHHIQLSDILKVFKGKVLLSGYPSRLQNKLYKGWKCQKRQIENKKKETIIELLWMNF